MIDSALLTHAEPAMGTVFSLTIAPGDLSRDTVRSTVESACAMLHRADAIFSTWDRQSPLSRFRRGEATLADLPAEVADVLTLCAEAKALSQGWFDPWAMPGGVDPTGLVKGWAVEWALDTLRASGAAGAMVNGGGDIAAFGAPCPDQRWRAGIRHPWRADALAGIIEVSCAVATSGRYERGGHLLHPSSGMPAAGVASATVTGPSLALADALATGLAVGGRDALASVTQADGYAGYLILSDGSELDTGDFAFVS